MKNSYLFFLLLELNLNNRCRYKMGYESQQVFLAEIVKP